jgi:L-lactate permease
LPIPLPESLLRALSALPIVLLFGGLLGFKWSLWRSAMWSLFLTIGLAVADYGMTIEGLAVALIKGKLLALFVLLVV